MKTKRNPLLTLLATSGLLSAAAHAAPFIWDGGNGDWNTTTSNWNTSTATWVNASDSTAVFGGTAGTVTLAEAITNNTLTFDTANYIVTGHTLTLAGTAPAIIANTDATINSNLAGSGGYTKSGSGILTLGGATNIITGAAVVNEGTVNLGLGAGGSSLTVNSGASVVTTIVNAIGYGTSCYTLNVNGGSFKLGVSGDSVWAMNTTLTGATMDSVSGANYSFGGNSAITVNASANTTSFTGAGVFKAREGQTGNNLNVSIADGAAATDFSITTAVQLVGSNLVLAGDGSSLISGVISGGYGLTKGGSGTLTLTGSNTYTGATKINGGVLLVEQNKSGFNSSVFHGAVTVNDGGTLTMNNNPVGWGGGLATLNVNKGGLVNGNGGLGAFGVVYNLTGGTIGGTSRIDLGQNGATLAAINSYASDTTAVINNTQGIFLRNDSGQTSYTITTEDGTTASGVDLEVTQKIGEWGTGAAVAKAGAGTLLLKGVNTYTGSTTISGGILQISGAGKLGNGAYAGTIGNSGVLQYSSSAAQTLSGIISGSGALIKDGAGDLTLSAQNTYSGSTTVSNGTLVLGSFRALGNSAINIDTGSTVRAAATNALQYYSKTLTVESGGTLTTSNGVVSNIGGSSGSLILQGGSTLASGTPNASWGSWVINTTGGVISVNGGSATAATISANKVTGSMSFNVSDVTSNSNTDLLVSGILGNGADSSSVTKSGDGTMTLTAANTYIGATTVSVGTLFVNGSLGNTAVSVASAATIGGSGDIAGTLSFDGASFLHVVDINDALAVAGTVTFGIGFGLDNITGWDYENAAIGTYTLIAGAFVDLANMDNVGLANAMTLGNGNKAYFEAGSLNVVINSVPEPAAALLGGIGLVTLLRRRRA